MALGTCVDLVTAKGTKVSIGDALPATFDASGYGGVSWTEIGMIESVGEFGPDASIGSFTPIGTGIACKFMGTTDNGEIALSIARTSDSGLAALLAHQGQAANLPFSVELSSGDLYYFPGLTRSAKVSVGTGDDVVKINATVVINGSIVSA
ncbi:hypothetical protein [Thiorhodococcus fuscus]|uniref:Phage tail protein n=1 Tax=Thiorhodococcus fuscus TaxID=527200 RepID=A0ABW4YAF3_9GAMM